MQVQEYLREYGIEMLTKTFSINAGYHETLPLVILTYHPFLSPKNNPIVDQCRGIVMELESFNIVAKGLDRFYNYGEKNVVNDFVFDNCRAEVKEDGTLIHMFCYKDQWLIANRYNFCEDIVGTRGTINNESPLTYEDLFYSICGKGFEQYLDKSVTYCLEMCAAENIIVKLYKTPSVYLLASFRDCVELDYVMPHFSPWLKPDTYMVTSLNQVYLLIETLSENQVFEGFVLVSNDNKRIKIKSSMYKILHNLKYRGLCACTKSSLAPFIKNNTIDYVIETLTCFRNEQELDEIRKRVDIIKANINDKRNDMFLDIDHPRYYCKLEKELRGNGLAKVLPIKVPDKNEWVLTCYCGNIMDSIRLRVDYVQYKTCHCGSRFDYKKYMPGTLIALCSKCPCSHELHQQDQTFKSGETVIMGQPTGIPASTELKNLRLYVHQLINNITKKHKVDKDSVYNKISSIMGLERHKTHIGLFTISDCSKIIIELQKIDNSS